MILSGKLDPDELYSETRLSAQMGISRTPMREAIQCLSQDGYITVVRSIHALLTCPLPAQALPALPGSSDGSDAWIVEKFGEEIIQIRCAIEGFCVHLAAVEIQSTSLQTLPP